MRETSIESLRTRGRPPDNRLPTAIGLLFVLLGGAQLHYFHRFAMARYAELPGNGAVELTEAGIPIADDGFGRLLESRMAAQSWLPRARPDRDLAEGYLARAVRAASPDGDLSKDLEAATERAMAATTRAPMDPTTLGAMPYIADFRGDTQSAVRDLALAYKLVPYWPETAFIRSWTAMKVWDGLDVEQQEHAKVDFRSGMERDAPTFTEMAVAGNFVDRVKEAFADDEDSLYALRIALRDREDREAQEAMDEEVRARTERWRQQQTK